MGLVFLDVLLFAESGEARTDVGEEVVADGGEGPAKAVVTVGSDREGDAAVWGCGGDELANELRLR